MMPSTVWWVLAIVIGLWLLFHTGVILAKVAIGLVVIGAIAYAVWYMYKESKK